MIDLSSNNLSGAIPEEVTNLVGLVALNLSRNHLAGAIPKKIGSLQNLEFLDLSRNRLSSDIPMGLSNLTFLNGLDLSYNNLSGSIPLGTQLQRFDASSFNANPILCGPPFQVNCTRTGTLFQGPPLPTDEDGTDTPIWFYPGLGIGYITGIWGVFVALLFNRSWRIVFFRFVEDVTDWVYVFTIVNVRKMKRRFRNA